MNVSFYLQLSFIKKKALKKFGICKANFAFIPDEEGRKIHGAIVNCNSSVPYVLENVSHLLLQPKSQKALFKASLTSNMIQTSRGRCSSSNPEIPFRP